MAVCPYCGAIGRVQHNRIIQPDFVYIQFYGECCKKAWAVLEGDARQPPHQMAPPSDKSEWWRLAAVLASMLTAKEPARADLRIVARNHDN
jgi:hypothetical protein